MNFISFMLYSVEVLTTFDVVALCASVVMGLISVIAFIVYLLAIMEAKSKYCSENLRGEYKELADSIYKHIGKCFVSTILLLLVTVFIPPKNTMYTIVASEVGEEVIFNTDIGEDLQEIATDSLKIVKQYINNQLKEGE